MAVLHDSDCSPLNAGGQGRVASCRREPGRRELGAKPACRPERYAVGLPAEVEEGRSERAKARAARYRHEGRKLSVCCFSNRTEAPAPSGILAAF